MPANTVGCVFHTHIYQPFPFPLTTPSHPSDTPTKVFVSVAHANSEAKPAQVERLSLLVPLNPPAPRLLWNTLQA